MRQAYIDCVKSHISALGVHANQGHGFSQSDLDYLRLVYPEYALTAGVSHAPQTTPPKEVAGLSRRQKLVIVGGGGIFALASLGVVFVIAASDDNTDCLEVQQEAQAAVTTSGIEITEESTTTSSTTTTLPLASSAIDYVTINERQGS